MAVDPDDLIDDEVQEEGNALFLDSEAIHDLDSDIPLHLQDIATAAQVGDVNSLRIALDNLNGNINEPVEDGDTVLHLVCLYGYLPCVQVLIERGADIEAKDEDGAIPLHDACAGGFSEIVRFLLNSADVECVKRMLETVDSEGDTPLHHAARGEHVNVIRMLLAAGASIKTRNFEGKKPSELPDVNTEAKSVLESAELL